MNESQLPDCTLQAARSSRKFPTLLSKPNVRVATFRLHVSAPIEGLGTFRLQYLSRLDESQVSDSMFPP